MGESAISCAKEGEKVLQVLQLKTLSLWELQVQVQVQVQVQELQFQVQVGKNFGVTFRSFRFRVRWRDVQGSTLQPSTFSLQKPRVNLQELQVQVGETCSDLQPSEEVGTALDS